MFAALKNKSNIDTETAYQVPRTSLTWMLVALVAIIAPHVPRMPVWLVGVCAVCVLARVLIHQGRLSYPGFLIKAGIVIIVMTAMVAQFGRDVFATESTVAILIVAICLKLLEMHRKRDVLLVVYLSYFTLIAEFIWSQSILIAAYMVGCVLLVTAALMSLNQTEEYQNPLRTLKLSSAILLQSVPLMLALFILFPRISPLWSVPLQSASARTGLSDSMSPGDIGDLIASDELAFRVSFEGEQPASSELYWRAITLDDFDGREWEQSFNFEPQYLGADRRETRDWFNNIEYQGDILEYNVIMEPTDENWIYTLKVPQIVDDRMVMRRDFQVDSVRNISQRFSYDMRSHLSHRVDTGVSQRLLRRWLSLPDNSNQESLQFAADMREQALSDEAYVRNVLDYFTQQEFFYTLSPPLLGENPVDEFLFATREGFCEHYASSFTFLMRAAGIPARVVTGYQGGEYNPYDNTLVVRQYDAHAWSEVWLEGQGWIRVDPTAAVAPYRIEQGSQFTFQEDEVFLQNAGLSLLRFRNSLFLNDLRYRLEMIDYTWNRFVLNYDQSMQFAFFSRFFNEVTREKIITSSLVFVFLSFSIIIFMVLRKPSRNHLNPATELYLGFCEGLSRQGLSRKRGETPWHYYQRLSRIKPAWAQQIREITEKYIDLVYRRRESDEDKAAIRDLKTQIRQFHMMMY